MRAGLVNGQPVSGAGLLGVEVGRAVDPDAGLGAGVAVDDGHIDVVSLTVGHAPPGSGRAVAQRRVRSAEQDGGGLPGAWRRGAVADEVDPAPETV